MVWLLNRQVPQFVGMNGGALYRKLLAYESVKMVGIYFSGTGNSEYTAELEDM